MALEEQKSKYKSFFVDMDRQMSNLLLNFTKECNRIVDSVSSIHVVKMQQSQQPDTDGTPPDVITYTFTHVVTSVSHNDSWNMSDVQD